MRNYATEKEKRIWKERYLQGETARDIAKDYPQYHESTISRNIKKMGISRNRKSYKTVAIQELVKEDFLNGCYCEDISKKYNVDIGTIYRILDMYKIKRKTGIKSKSNEDYFEKIDSPNKAYLLGFITADGSITGKYNQSCSIEINEKDIELIYFAQKEIAPNAVITSCKSNKKNNVKISFNSVKLCNDLSKYGIVPNKSKIIKEVPLKLIPKEFLCFYFRGLIDGDGCIHKDGRVSIYSGSLDYIQSVQEILIKEIDLKKLKIYEGTTYFISWGSKNDRQKLYNYIYKDKLNETFFYKRKFERLHNSLYDNTEVID